MGKRLAKIRTVVLYPMIASMRAKGSARPA